MDALSPEAELAEADALLRLQRVPGLGDRGILRLVQEFGCGRAALGRSDAELAAALGGRGVRAAAALGEARSPESRAAVDAMLARAEEVRARVVPMGAADYPQRLLDLIDPPPVLFLRGEVGLLDRPSVALVGSRRATGYGRRVSSRLAAGLARHGAVVLSGLALGVDGEAHRAALAAAGTTVAVLGCGPDVAHPRAHRSLFADVVERGLVVSEFPPGTGPEPHHFPRRNRIMAALAQAVVVVEAAERSGALITARHALDLGREVLAVPGPIDAPSSAGTNALLRDGAHPALGPEDVLAFLGVSVRTTAVPAPESPDAAAVWATLGAAPLGVDEVATRTGLPARRALAALSVLELDGWAVQSGGARFARRA